jgi:hypothetical protein
MTTPRSSSVSPRPRPATTNRLFQPSTAGWYAQWKARQQAAAAAPEPTPVAGPEVASPDDAAEALAQWLTGGADR